MDAVRSAALLQNRYESEGRADQGEGRVSIFQMLAPRPGVGRRPDHGAPAPPSEGASEATPGV